MRRPPLLLSRLLPFLLVAGACRSPEPLPGITVLLESATDSLDDRLALTANGQRIAQLIAPGLMTFDDASAPQPDLAQSYALPTPTLLELKLRPGLRFHDGSVLDAADVKATYDALLSGTFASPRNDKLKIIERVEAPDPLTIRFILKRPYAPILAELSIGIVPSERASGPLSALQDTAPIGAGAFRFHSQPDEEHLTLLPFEGYYGGAPQIPRLHFRVVRDETTRVLELLKGRADLLINAVSPSVLPVLRGASQLRVLSQPGTGFAYLGFNLRQGPLADARVRRALCHLINVQPIVHYKLHDLALPARGMLPRKHWAFQDTDGCAYDPKEAARLLDAAGFKDPDGPGGAPRLRLSMKTSTDRFRKSVALVLQEQLAQGGVEVELRSLEFGTFFSDIRKGNFELFTLKWVAVIEPDLLRGVFHSENIPSEANRWAGWNRGALKDTALDALLQQASEEGALPQRQVLYGQALQRLDALLPYVPLWHESSVAVVSSRLQDFTPSTHGFFTPLAKARWEGKP